jgi:hypothetical protein
MLPLNEALSRIRSIGRRAANRGLTCSSNLARCLQLLLAAAFPQQKALLLMTSASYAPGMFSQVASVLGLLEHYEAWHQSYAGLCIDFGDQGLYYDPVVGENWWGYYFEPIEIGTMDGACRTVVSARWQSDLAGVVEIQMPRARGADLVRRHFRARPHIISRVESFASLNFSDTYVVGIHYRGTDKYLETPRIPYEAVVSAVRDKIRPIGVGRFKLFVATDEQAFLEHLKALFPDCLLYCEAFRSVDGQPIDIRMGDNYKKGEEAILDCLLLARCDCLIRTSSNLSLFSTFFNPAIPEILLAPDLPQPATLP